MKRASAIFLQVILVLFGIGVLAFMLLEPTREGRNVHATLFQVYFQDPFLAYAYIASVAFFIALYQAFRLMGRLGRNEVFSQHSVDSLRTIKYCAMGLVGALLGAEGYFFLVMRGKDDIAGGVMLGFLLTIIATIIGTAAAVFERTLQSAVDLKSDQDLTV